MSNKKSNPIVEGLDEAIVDVLKEMKDLTADSQEYGRMVEQLDKLYKMKQTVAPSRISPDTLFNTIAGAVVNLTGIGMIIGYEKANVITSKAFNIVGKTKV